MFRGLVFLLNTVYINTNPIAPLVQIVEQIAGGKLFTSKTFCNTLTAVHF